MRKCVQFSMSELVDLAKVSPALQRAMGVESSAIGIICETGNSEDDELWDTFVNEGGLKLMFLAVEANTV